MFNRIHKVEERFERLEAIQQKLERHVRGRWGKSHRSPVKEAEPPVTLGGDDFGDMTVDTFRSAEVSKTVLCESAGNGPSGARIASISPERACASISRGAKGRQRGAT